MGEIEEIIEELKGVERGILNDRNKIKKAISILGRIKTKDLMLSEEEIFELILEYASTHPHRDYSIGVKGYDDIPVKKRREENITHWKALAKELKKEQDKNMKFQIMNRRELENIDLQEDCAIISITGQDEEHPRSWIFITNKYLKDIITLEFDDVDKDGGLRDEYKTITRKQARQILDFYEKVKDKVDLIICQCNAGISRSSAVAGALSIVDGKSDSWVFDNPKYVPNMRVYNTILNERAKRKGI